MEPLPLADYSLIAMRAGVRRPVITMWRSRHAETFPNPVADLTVGPIWWWPEMQHWLEITGRRWDANWTLDQIDPQRRDRTDRFR